MTNKQRYAKILQDHRNYYGMQQYLRDWFSQIDNAMKVLGITWQGKPQ